MPVIAIYGQGKMGLPLAQVMAKYNDVIGVDINAELVTQLNLGFDVMPDEPGLGKLLKENLGRENYKATTDFSYASKNATVHILLVPTLIKDNKPDLSIIKDVVTKVSAGLKKGDIVITESTMPPGSTEGLIPLLEHSGLKLGDFGLAHCPERTMSGTAIRDIEGQYPKIIGAGDKRTEKITREIYKKINSKGVRILSSIKAAELVKVFEGCYRDVNIALANELSYVCEREGVDSTEIFEAANSQPYCKIHRPGYVGGHCIPYYPWFVIDEKTKVMRSARMVNEAVIDRLIEKTKEGIGEAGKALKESNILVLGLTFRGGVHETEHSAAGPFIEKIRPSVKEIYAYDPLCNEKDYAHFGVAKKEGFEGIDCAVILSDHAEFSNLDWKEKLKGIIKPVIVDGRGIHDERLDGFIYKSLGKS